MFYPLKCFLVHYHAQKISAGVGNACSNRRSFLPEWIYLVNTCLQTSDSNLSEFCTWTVFFVVFVSSMLFYFLSVQRNNTVLFFRFDLISIPHFLCADHGNAKLPLCTASGYSEPRRRWLFLGCPCPGPHSLDWVRLATTSDPLSLEVQEAFLKASKELKGTMVWVYDIFWHNLGVSISRVLDF